MNPPCKLVGLGNQRHDLVFEIFDRLFGHHRLHGHHVHALIMPDFMPVVNVVKARINAQF